jgi:hypothetical protein
MHAARTQVGPRRHAREWRICIGGEEVRIYWHGALGTQLLARLLPTGGGVARSESIWRDVAMRIWPELTQKATAHNPEVAGSNPAPATGKAPESGLSVLSTGIACANFCPVFA